MRLHDDLLLNGYHTTRLWIGTLPQSSLLLLIRGVLLHMFRALRVNSVDRKFQPELSSTYQPVKCNIDCTCDSDGVQCVYDRQYEEMSSSSGVLGEDIISFGNESELVPQRAVLVVKMWKLATFIVNMLMA